MEDAIVVFASYNKGEEFEKKLENVRKLKQQGINVNLFYLLELTSNDELPKTNVDFMMIDNIEKAIHTFKPNILAFHNGITISLKKEEFIRAVNSIRRSNPRITCLLEHLNSKERHLKYVFKTEPEFLKWCELNFETEHNLYDLIWKPKI